MTALAQRSMVAAGYVPLDIVSFQGRVWHAAGGTAGNVAALLGFLGWNASLVAELGDDDAGKQALRDLKKANVSTDYVRLNKGVRTPRLVHEISGGGHRYLFRCPDCGQSLPSSRPLRTDRALELCMEVAAPDVFFFDRLNAGTLTLAEHFAGNGSLIVFEPSRPARESFTRRAVDVADVIKYANDRDSGLDNIEPANRRQLRVVTAGAAGASYRVGKGAWHESPAFSYPIVDAGGAGDWTTAGLIHALPENRTVRAVGDALRWAQALAAVSCGAPGARGLARQQSASTVLRAAQFLEQRRGQASPELVEQPWKESKVRGSVCRWCLQVTDGTARGVQSAS
jgi:fructokinase